MSEALNFNCCPQCGRTETLEALDKKIKELEDEKIRRELAQGASEYSVPLGRLRASGNLPSYAGVTANLTSFDRVEDLRLEMSTCAHCGIVWRKDAATEARMKRERISKIVNETYDAVERLGQLGDPDRKDTARDTLRTLGHDV